MTAQEAGGTSNPIIVTAGMAPEATRRLDDLRRRYFPAGRTVIGAHLTLFHAIPWSAHGALCESIRGLCDETPPFLVALPRVYSLGRGAAVRVESPQLVALRERIAAPLRESLTAQDAQPFRPHITITNKLAANEAKAVFELLQAEWTPAETTIESLVVWRYMGPHWQLDLQVPLTGDGSPAH